MKQFRAHLGASPFPESAGSSKGSPLRGVCGLTFFPAGALTGMSISADGMLLCTSSEEKSIKIFDVISFGACVPSPAALSTSLVFALRCVGLSRGPSDALGLGLGLGLASHEGRGMPNPTSYRGTSDLRRCRVVPSAADMINMVMNMDYIPVSCEWINDPSRAAQALIAWCADSLPNPTPSPHGPTKRPQFLQSNPC